MKAKSLFMFETTYNYHEEDFFYPGCNTVRKEHETFFNTLVLLVFYRAYSGKRKVILSFPSNYQYKVCVLNHAITLTTSRRNLFSSQRKHESFFIPPPPFLFS